jgi:hypothetical protein
MRRTLNRRSFLAAIVGGGAAALGAAGAAEAQRRPRVERSVVDSDPGDPARAAGQAGTGARCSDQDAGQTADPAGRGRRCNRRMGGCTDRDTGSNADPIGRGRRCGGAPRERFVVCPGSPRCPR